MKGKRIVCNIPIKEFRCIERLVESGRYKSVGDFVQIAIRKLLVEEVDKVELSEKDLKSIRKALGI